MPVKLQIAISLASLIFQTANCSFTGITHISEKISRCCLHLLNIGHVQGGVSGGFPGILPFRPTYPLAGLYELNNLERDIKLNQKKKIGHVQPPHRAPGHIEQQKSKKK